MRLCVCVCAYVFVCVSSSIVSQCVYSHSHSYRRHSNGHSLSAAVGRRVSEGGAVSRNTGVCACVCVCLCLSVSLCTSHCCVCHFALNEQVDAKPLDVWVLLLLLGMTIHRKHAETTFRKKTARLACCSVVLCGFFPVLLCFCVFFVVCRVQICDCVWLLCSGVFNEELLKRAVLETPEAIETYSHCVFSWAVVFELF